MRNIKIENNKLISYLGDKKIREFELSEIYALTIEKIDYFKTMAGAVFLAVPIIGIFNVDRWLDNKIAKAPLRPPIKCCPFVYSYDGDQFVFDAEPYGGSICQGLERTEWCRLDYLKAVNGQYRILVRNELDETQYTDEMKIVVVDHPKGTTVVPEVLGRMHSFSAPLPPLQAYDQKGRDILPLVSQNDYSFWQSNLEGRDPDRKEDIRDELTFEFSKPANAKQVKLVANAWTTFQGSLIAKEYLGLFGGKVAEWFQDVNRFGPANREIWNWYFNEGLYILKIFVETKDGWKARGMLYGGGPFIVKERAYVLDISDVQEDVLRIKLLPAAGFWLLNYLGAEYGEDAPFNITEIEAVKAQDKNGQDATELLAKDDNRYLVLSDIGDAAELVYDAPAPRPGLERTVFLKARGYYDIHLQAKGEPQTELIQRIFHEPGFAAQYALKKFQKSAAGLKEK